MRIETNPCQYCDLAPCICGREIEDCMVYGCPKFPTEGEQINRMEANERFDISILCNTEDYDKDGNLILYPSRDRFYNLHKDFWKGIKDGDKEEYLFERIK